MEFLKNLFNPLTERTKSPLYSSVLISWLIWNWKIVFTLLLVSQDDFEDKGMIQFIQDNYINPWDNFVFPILTAVFYIFALPYAEKFVFIFTEKRKREKVEKKIEIGKIGSVEGSLYYELKFKFEEEKSKVLTIDKDLTDARNKLAKAHSDLNISRNESGKLQDKNQDWQEKFNDFQKRHNLEPHLNGRWIVTYFDKDSILQEEHVHIYSDKYNEVGSSGDKHLYDIKLFEYDEGNSRMRFVKYDVNIMQQHKVVDLNVISNERFEGNENYKRVTYTRPKYDRNKPNELYQSDLINQIESSKLIEDKITKQLEQIVKDKRLEDESKF